MDETHLPIDQNRCSSTEPWHCIQQKDEGDVYCENAILVPGVGYVCHIFAMPMASLYASQCPLSTNMPEVVSKKRKKLNPIKASKRGV